MIAQQTRVEVGKLGERWLIGSVLMSPGTTHTHTHTQMQKMRMGEFGYERGEGEKGSMPCSQPADAYQALKAG